MSRPVGPPLARPEPPGDGRVADTASMAQQPESRSMNKLKPNSEQSPSELTLGLARRRAWTAQQRNYPNLSTDPSPRHLTFEAARDGQILLASADEENEKVIREALKARGTRYRWGGASRGGFDCSGFTRYMFGRYAGIELPHSASAQARYGRKVAHNRLEPGDLLFFRTYRRGISHVGIYIGDRKFVHAANRRSSVRVDSLDSAYYRNRFVTARRLVEDEELKE